MLIAEISNAHFGSFDRAKEMIRIANECGADLIKAQAFKAEDIRSGSMPREFYEQCAFSVPQYLELIDYARDIGNDLFYSIFSEGMEEIEVKQTWQKVTGFQMRQGKARMVRDTETLIVSVPFPETPPKFKKANVLHVSEYCTTCPQLWRIQKLSDVLERPVGYSDHTIGIKHAISARRFFGANIIEKHFCLLQNESFKGIVYRDSVHGANPRELEELARELWK